MFWRIMSLPSSGWKNKPSKKPAGKHVIETIYKVNISVSGIRAVIHEHLHFQKQNAALVEKMLCPICTTLL
jgi:hypothetical protein